MTHDAHDHGCACDACTWSLAWLAVRAEIRARDPRPNDDLETVRLVRLARELLGERGRG